MTYTKIVVPTEGERITVREGKLSVPDNPILLWIEGDGIGPDIMTASKRIWDAAVAKAYGGQRKIAWMEIYSGEKAAALYGGDYFPAESLRAIREFQVGIKGPLTTPVGGGFRSLNVALRMDLDLYACIRPVKWYPGVPSPLRRPDLVDVVIFRENTEDVYAGVEYKAGSPEAAKVEKFLKEEMGAKFLAELRHRHQADQRVRHQAAGPQGVHLRAGARPQERDFHAQGQHPEVHRGRVHAVGLRGGEAGVRRCHRHRGAALGRVRRPVACRQAVGQGSHRGHHVPADAAAAG